MYLFLHLSFVLVSQDAHLSLSDRLVFVLLHQFGVLAVQHFPLFTFLQVHKGVCFLLSLPLHQEHTSLVSFFDFLCQFFLLNLLKFRLLFFLTLVLVKSLCLGLSDASFLSLFLFFFAPSFLFLLLGQLLTMSHDHVFLVIDRFLELFLLLDVGLATTLLFFTTLSLDIVEAHLKLVKCHLFQESNRNMLNLLLWPCTDLFLKLANLKDQLLSFLHLYLLLLFLLLQNTSSLFLLLIVDLTILLQKFLLLNFDIFFAFLHLLNQFLLRLKFFSL